MTGQRFIRTIDQISYWSGKAASWLIVALTFVVSIEVFKRYILNAPTAWIFDFNNMLYGTLFMMCGAYTLSKDGHVRGDFLYGSMRPRLQASFDLVLYIVFFLPGVGALTLAGWTTSRIPWRCASRPSTRRRCPSTRSSSSSRSPGPWC